MSLPCHFKFHRITVMSHNTACSLFTYVLPSLTDPEVDSPSAFRRLASQLRSSISIISASLKLKSEAKFLCRLSALYFQFSGVGVLESSHFGKVDFDSSLASPSKLLPTGTCILVEGVLKKPSAKGKQVIELEADRILHIGTVDPDRYPFSKKRLPLDMSRDFSHFRPRTTMVNLNMIPREFFLLTSLWVG